MKDKIVEILNNTRPEFDFAEEQNFIDSGLLDSFDLVTLVADLESTFQISIDGADILPENFQSIESIETLITSSRAKL